MTKTIYSIISDPEALLALEPEELAGIVLEVLNSTDQMQRGQLNRYNFSLPQNFKEYPQQYQEQISKAVMEAWVWLEREGLIAPEPGSQGEWVFVTRRGKQITSASDLQTYRRSDLLPKGSFIPPLHKRFGQHFSKVITIPQYSKLLKK